VFGGLKDDGYVLINSSRSFADLGLTDLLARCRPDRLRTVAATELAREHLGRPLPNAALLGGFAALSGIVSLDSVTAAIEERFAGDVGRRNAAAARGAYELVDSLRTTSEEPTHV
jgi:pyruvate ferredoxin oxidoreductase gamma subunit